MKNKLLTLITLIVLMCISAFFHLRNLAKLNLWGDESLMALAVQGILKTGLPLLPTNYPYIRIITYSYPTALLTKILGYNLFSLRILAVIFSVLSIILIYCFGKELFDEKIGLVSAFILTFSVWQIELGRMARYFSMIQFFFILGLYLFYKAHKTEFKSNFYTFSSLIIFILAVFTFRLGILLVLAYIFVLLAKGFKIINKKLIIHFIIFITLTLFWVLFGTFSWLGRGYFEYSTFSLSNFIHFPKLFFFGLYFIMFSKISIFIFLATIILTIIHYNKKMSFLFNIKNLFHSNIFYLYFIFIFGLMIMEILNIGYQPRYLLQFYPIFILIFSYLLIELTSLIVLKIGKVKLLLFSLVFIALTLVTIQNISVVDSYTISERDYGDNINIFLGPSTAYRIYPDYETPHDYIKKNIRPKDIIISVDPPHTYIYLGKVDYTLEPKTSLSIKKNDDYANLYTNAVLLENIEDLTKVINENKQVWLVTTIEKPLSFDLDEDFINFLDSNKKYIVYTAKDNSYVYKFNQEYNQIVKKDVKKPKKITIKNIWEFIK